MSESLHFQCVLMNWKRKTLSMSSLLMERIFRLAPNEIWWYVLSGCQVYNQGIQYHVCSTYRGLWVWWLSGCRSSVTDHWQVKSDVLGLILTNCWPHLSPCVGKQLTVLLHTQIAQHACVLKHTANNELLILVQAQPIRSKHQGMVTY